MACGRCAIGWVGGRGSVLWRPPPADTTGSSVRVSRGSRARAR
ncbi:hypothetical protein CZ771_11435 [Actinomycetales bacterium JB111]|nr:hypothetical protein CZ771_11435 [Actinomycetales bacterium JB111]